MSARMIITHIRGGLGNQMFQYAAGRAVAAASDAELKLDLSWFSGPRSSRKFMLRAFPYPAYSAATKAETEALRYKPAGFLHRLFHRHGPYAGGYIREPQDFVYWTGIESITGPAYLSGFWQNEKYFANIAGMIRREFMFPPLPDEARELGERMADTPGAVAVHVRRGDYVSMPGQEICNAAYYGGALAAIAGHVGESAELFIVSDEPEWVREHFDARGMPFTVVDFPSHRDEPWHDMHLMSLCGHHIIANSTFSWWSAWLADKEGVIIAPKRWFSGAPAETGPVPARWIQV
jgi:hypothetical protein